ncbi:HD domain-containing protein [Roseateles oligotrophus]|uniref:HD domain-containing protein n=1 Tax=Roseateles oligotrophus TaxID=1769250 RepID=A0ABT2Y9A7_9BURK|nr:hypothetical protein [Roseateles oligotrophus]MCV2366895.1 hypothetical protein [Roseateles oligotrophus]
MGIGTLDWTRRGGMLTLNERWRLTLAAIGKRARLHKAARAGETPAALKLLDRLGLGALDYIEQPWDALAFAASTAAQELQPQWLSNHGWRTYAWGTLLALDGNLEYDKNLFFAACMLHDLGLTPHAAQPADQCFTLRSALAARSILQRAGASPAQLDCVAQAITLHPNLEVGIEQGVEAHLLQAGAAFDVVGQRSHELPAALQAGVLGRHPRLGFKQSFCACMQMQAQATPNSRMGLYVRRLGFLTLIQQAPFDE